MFLNYITLSKTPFMTYNFPIPKCGRTSEQQQTDWDEQFDKSDWTPDDTETKNMRWIKILFGERIYKKNTIYLFIWSYILPIWSNFQLFHRHSIIRRGTYISCLWKNWGQIHSMFLIALYQRSVLPIILFTEIDSWQMEFGRWLTWPQRVLLMQSFNSNLILKRI